MPPDWHSELEIIQLGASPRLPIAKNAKNALGTTLMRASHL